MRKKEKPMQIILVQSEVEEALRSYIAARLTLAEGTAIKIALSATRGDDGIKATIDLVEPGTQQVVAAAAPAPATKPAATVVVKETAQQPNTALDSAKATLAAATSGKQPEQAQEQAADASTTGAPAEAGAAANASADVAQAEPQAAEGGAQTKSLFSGLTRPKNS